VTFSFSRNRRVAESDGFSGFCELLGSTADVLAFFVVRPEPQRDARTIEDGLPDG